MLLKISKTTGLFKGRKSARDQTIEQTVNKDSKTKGGIVGFSLNKGAVHRWIMSQAERSAISGRCQEMANMSELTR